MAPSPLATYEPVAFVQRLQSRRAVLVCGHCGAFCGGDAHPTVHCVAKRCPLSREALALALKEHGVADGGAARAVVFCRDGCGATFCGAACEAAARAAHAPLCCGTRDEHDPLVAFKMAALESGRYDEVALAADALARAAADPACGAAAWVARAAARPARPAPPGLAVDAAALWDLLAAGAPEVQAVADAAAFAKVMAAVARDASATPAPAPARRLFPDA